MVGCSFQSVLLMNSIYTTFGPTVIPRQTCALCLPFVISAIFLRRRAVLPYDAFGHPLSNVPHPRVWPFYFLVVVLLSVILHRLTVTGARFYGTVPHSVALFSISVCRSQAHVAVVGLDEPLWVALVVFSVFAVNSSDITVRFLPDRSDYWARKSRYCQSWLSTDWLLFVVDVIAAVVLLVTVAFVAPSVIDS